MNNCVRFNEGLVSLAHGEDAPEAQQHADACAACGRQLVELRAMVDGLSLKSFDAPDSMRLAAQQLMPNRPQIFARLARNTLELSGARAADADSFQLVFEADTLRARLLYERSTRGWSITGQIDGGVDELESEGQELVLEPGGRFAFEASTLAQTTCRVSHQRTVVVIPAAATLNLDGTEPSA